MRTRLLHLVGRAVVVLALTVLTPAAAFAASGSYTGGPDPETPDVTCPDGSAPDAEGNCVKGESTGRDKTPDPAPDTGPIPALGIDAGQLALLGLGALVLGGGAVVVARRRAESNA